MNKTELIDALAPRLGGRAAAGTAVEAVVDVVLRQVAAGSSVGITGFGTFERVERAPRTGRNPRTGDAVPIPGTAAPRFRPGTYFKDAVADPSLIPEDGPAGTRSSAADQSGEAATAGAGTPETVRRTGSGSARTPSEARASAARGSSGKKSRPATTGTPDSVRKDRTPKPESTTGAASRPATDVPTKSSAGAAVPEPPGTTEASGGDHITARMISAKKAQLAQVKDDELAARKKAKKKQDKKAKKKGKKKSKKKS